MQLKRRHELLGEPLPSHSTAGYRGRGRGRGRGGRGGGGGGTYSTEWDMDWAGESLPPPAESIEAQRRALQLGQFFMAQLPSEMRQETPYDEEPKANEQPNQGANAQQVLLRLVSTEAALRRELHGKCTIMRADLEWCVNSVLSTLPSGCAGTSTDGLSLGSDHPCPMTQF